MFTSPSYVSLPPTILPWGTLTAPHAGKGKERCEENTNKGENISRPTQVTCSCAWDKVMLDCLSWNKVWTKVGGRQVFDGRQAWRWRRRKGLDWCFDSLLLLVVCLLWCCDIVATCCCPCCCPCWGWSTAKGSSGQQTPGTKRDLKQMEPRNWTRSAKSRGQSWDMSQDICSPARM